MKWNANDLEQYIKAKEYIDTVLFPLIPFHFSNDSRLGKNAMQSESLLLFTNEIEKELSGRVLLAPGYNYLKNDQLDKEAARLNLWVEDAQRQPFKHVLFITFDPVWRKYENELNGQLIWIPGIQGNLHSKEMATIIRGQAEEIGELIHSLWKND
ncbi:DUF2487 family protein [Virgibacillus sp. W0430]|uniref:DUF2487 family protein n=1 Tax=Virgibacillus sp. W0430 TaxID=3391580 RepID=UPI003F47D952